MWHYTTARGATLCLNAYIYGLIEWVFLNCFRLPFTLNPQLTYRLNKRRFLHGSTVQCSSDSGEETGYFTNNLDSCAATINQRSKWGFVFNETRMCCFVSLELRTTQHPSWNVDRLELWVLFVFRQMSVSVSESTYVLLSATFGRHAHSHTVKNAEMQCFAVDWHMTAGSLTFWIIVRLVKCYSFLLVYIWHVCI